MKLNNIIQNQVIKLQFALIMIGTILYIKYKRAIFLFLFAIVFVINEILFNLTGFDIYSSAARTEILYSADSVSELLAEQGRYIDGNAINRTNLTEGIYHNNDCISSEKAEIQRFDEFIKLLDLKAGDVVLDAGCGKGGLVDYLRRKGIDAYGITITKTQYNDNTEKYGPYFYYGDYTKFNSKLVDRFDSITIPGSLEHPFGDVNPRFESSFVNKYNKMTELFRMFQRYFKPKSPKKNILVTCIHANLKTKNDYRWNVSGRMFGGCLPAVDKYSVADAFKNADYSVTLNKDYTWHYYFASYCDMYHFGNPHDIGLVSFLSFPLYPFIIYTYIYWLRGYWMWMWSGRDHKPRKEILCDPKNGCDLYFEKDRDKRPGTLFYTVAQMGPSS
jgi:cyclopropane fatty-acyl-phospholipid synthase-like methyltransferase